MTRYQAICIELRHARRAAAVAALDRFLRLIALAIKCDLDEAREQFAILVEWYIARPDDKPDPAEDGPVEPVAYATALTLRRVAEERGCLR